MPINSKNEHQDRSRKCFLSDAYKPRKIFWNIKKDARMIYEYDAALHSKLEIILYPGWWALVFHRFAHLLYLMDMFFLARFVAFIPRVLFAIDIHPGARIAGGIMIDHATGVIIGETCCIDEGCMIYQNSTLGGTGNEKQHDRHPKLAKNVVIGAGAIVLGNLVVGENSRIGANTLWIKDDVPPYHTVVGVIGESKPSRRHIRPTLSHDDLPNIMGDMETKLNSICNEIEAQKFSRINI